MRDRVDGVFSKKSQWTEVFPYGVTFSADQVRPVMIFKDKREKKVLPVWLSPLDAGIAISQQDIMAPPSSPHNLTLKVLSQLGVELDACYFGEMRGRHQYVELEFSGSKKLKSLWHRIDEALSFCLNANSKFFVSDEFLEASRVVQAEQVTELSRKNLIPGGWQKRPPYMN